MAYNIATTTLPVIQKTSASKKSGYPVYNTTDLPMEQGCHILPLSPEHRKNTPVLVYVDEPPNVGEFITFKKELYSVEFRNTAKNTGFCIVHKVTDKKLTDKKQIGSASTMKNEADICCPYCGQKPVFKKTELKRLNKGEPIEFTCTACKASSKVTLQK